MPTHGAQGRCHGHRTLLALLLLTLTAQAQERPIPPQEWVRAPTDLWSFTYETDAETLINMAHAKDQAAAIKLINDRRELNQVRLIREGTEIWPERWSAEWHPRRVCYRPRTETDCSWTVRILTAKEKALVR